MKRALLLSMFLTPACAPMVTDGVPHGATPDPGDPTSAPAMPATPPPMPPSASGCGAQTFPLAADAVQPNVYLVVDRSGSMSDPFGTNTFGSKWVSAQGALMSLLTGSNGKARWGLSLFPPNPAQNTCGKALVDVPLAAGSEAQVLGKINGLTDFAISHPRGQTPTADALRTVRDAAALTATDRDNYVVLVTDGIPECNNPADVGNIIDQLYARTPAVRTFVVGVGSECASNPDLLNKWAQRGHTARNDPQTQYYQANDSKELGDALQAVVAQTASCVFTLQAPPADPSLVVGQLDKMPLPLDAANGFTYDAATQAVTFHGASCDQITQGTAKSVDVVYGCPPPVVL